LLNPRDIAYLKISALAGGATKRDSIDVYAVSKYHEFERYEARSDPIRARSVEPELLHAIMPLWSVLQPV